MSDDIYFCHKEANAGLYFLMVQLNFRARAVILTATWLILLVVSLSLLSFLLTIFNSNPRSQSIVSLSWAGYTISEGVAESQLEVSFINASWVVPKVNASASNGYSSAWIGIGGQSDSTLIQVGTEHNLLGGKEVYNVWYEMLPDFAITVPGMAITPGDVVVASITLTNRDTHEWSMQLRDVTNGQTFNKNVIYNSTRSSGEWIVERPTVNKQITSLADFGSVTFSDCYIKVNDVTGAIGNFTFSRVQMTNQQTTQLASVSPLNVDVSGFTVNYLKSQ